MQAAVPLQYEFQLNGRISLTVLATGLHQSNLTTALDAVTINGVDKDPAAVSSGSLKTAIETAIKNWVIDNKAVPV